MNIITTKILSDHQTAQINQMWNDEYPVKFKDRFPMLLQGAEYFNHYLIEDAEENVIAWAVDFVKEKEVRFSIIVHSKHKGKGLGSLLVEKLKMENNLFYGWVIDHNNDLKNNETNYQSPISFYLRHGFVILNDLRMENEMIQAVKVRWGQNES